MARILYSIVVIALLPWALLHLMWRARRQPEYLQHCWERFRFCGAAATSKTDDFGCMQFPSAKRGQRSLWCPGPARTLSRAPHPVPRT